jgi:signal transduction histidine kinase
VTVEVRDPGRSGPDSASSTAGAGHGLIGMRERVAVFGGRLSAGPSPDGGYLLTATLPFGEPTAVSPAVAAVGGPA